MTGSSTAGLCAGVVSAASSLRSLVCELTSFARIRLALRRALGSPASDGTRQSTTNKLDYIFVSKNLAPKVVAGGIERHGLWGDPDNTNPPAAWDIYPAIKESSEAASDHAAVFVGIDF
jgi:hypothetical protein